MTDLSKGNSFAGEQGPRFDALTRPIPAEDVARYVAEHKLSKKLRNQLLSTLGVIALMVIVFTSPILTRDINGSAQYLIIVALYILGMIVAGIIGVVVFRRIRIASAQTLLRALAFARDNGYTLIEEGGENRYPGMYFYVGDNRRTTDIITGTTTAGAFEIGTILYETGSGRSRQTMKMGYVRIGLQKNLPQIVLDGRVNNTSLFGLSISNLPVSYRGNVKLDLEGDFNKHFTLYAPVGYETDALYIFTPDLMARFIDGQGIYDAEIVDDGLYIYGKAVNYGDPAQIRGLFGIIATIGAKAISQTRRYEDARVVTPGTVQQVAPQGRRLKSRTPILTIIISIAVVLFSILHFASAIGRLFTQ